MNAYQAVEKLVVDSFIKKHKEFPNDTITIPVMDLFLLQQPSQGNAVDILTFINILHGLKRDEIIGMTSGHRIAFLTNRYRSKHNIGQVGGQ